MSKLKIGGEADALEVLKSYESVFLNEYTPFVNNDYQKKEIRRLYDDTVKNVKKNPGNSENTVRNFVKSLNHLTVGKSGDFRIPNIKKVSLDDAAKDSGNLPTSVHRVSASLATAMVGGADLSEYVSMRSICVIIIVVVVLLLMYYMYYIEEKVVTPATMATSDIITTSTTA
jgi:hypothetical protein